MSARLLDDEVVPAEGMARDNTANLNPKMAADVLDEGDHVLKPRKLAEGRTRCLDTIISLALAATTVLLFVFAAIVARLDGQTVGADSSWDEIQAIYNKLATLFPILFSIVVGGSIKRFAAWRLERGTRLGLLELLMGSLTVGGTASAVWGLRAFNMVAVLLGLLWSLSPLGSQSSLLMISIKQVPITSNMNVSYFDIALVDTARNDTAAGSEFRGGDLWMIPGLNALYNTALLQSAISHAAATDIWGNVKIPDLTRSTADFSLNSSGWVDFSSPGNQNKSITYSSLLGIPLNMTGLPAGAVSSFTVESAYLSLSCTNVTVIANGQPQSRCQALPSGQPKNDTFYTTPPGNAPITWSLCLDGFYNMTEWGFYGHVGVFFGNDATAVPPARTLLFEATNLDPYALAFCTVTTSYVESAVQCTDGAQQGSCAVEAMRASAQPHPDSNFTDLSFTNTFSEISQFMVQSVGPDQHDGTSSPTEFFILNPALVNEAGQIQANWTGVDPAGLQIRLQQALNTFFYGSWSPPSFMGGASAPFVRSSVAQVGVPRNAYVVHWGWWAVFVLATLAVTAGALAGAGLGWVSAAPDVLGYCSSLAASSAFVREGHGVGSTMGGLERARTFAALRVRMVDVHPESQIGFVALAQDDDSGALAMLRQDRLYA